MLHNLHAYGKTTISKDFRIISSQGCGALGFSGSAKVKWDRPVSETPWQPYTENSGLNKSPKGAPQACTDVDGGSKRTCRSICYNASHTASRQAPPTRPVAEEKVVATTLTASQPELYGRVLPLTCRKGTIRINSVAAPNRPVEPRSCVDISAFRILNDSASHSI